MKTIRTVLFCTIAASGMVAVPAAAITIDFDLDANGNTLAPGAFTGNEYASMGVHFSAITPDPDGHVLPTQLYLFDADCGGGPASNCTGNDPDLFFPGQGNILIVQDDRDTGVQGDPDDHGAPGGLIVIEFDFAAYLDTLVLGDLEANQPAIIRGYNSGVLTETFYTANNVLNAFALTGFDGITRLEIEFEGSGALLGLNYQVSRTAIPEPTSLLLFGLGIAGLGFSRRRLR